MKKILLFALTVFAINCLWAQGTAEELKDFGYGAKKLKKAPKEIYLHQFVVNYQMVSSSSETSAGGKTKTQMAVGLQGIDPSDVQDITDQAYQYLVERLTNMGYTIKKANDAKGIEMFEDWVEYEGGNPSRAQLMGYLATSPSGEEFLVKGLKKSGKVKSTLFDILPKISKEMGDILVWDSNVNFQFVTIEGKTFINDATKLKGEVEFVIPQTAIAQSSEGFLGGGSIQTQPTAARVCWKGGAAGAGAIASVMVQPKKSIVIDGVVEKKKFKEYVSPDRNAYVNEYYGIVFEKDKSVEVSHLVKADADAYQAKTLQALKDYIDVVLALLEE